jgi:hypothetical protein
MIIFITHLQRLVDIHNDAAKEAEIRAFDTSGERASSLFLPTEIGPLVAVWHSAVGVWHKGSGHWPCPQWVFLAMSARMCRPDGSIPPVFMRRHFLRPLLSKPKSKSEPKRRPHRRFRQQPTSKGRKHID